MYLLGIHNGNHDASACLFHDYEMVAAVSLERLVRKKNAGVTPDAEMPFKAIDECLAIAGIRRSDVDVVCSTRSHWELQSYELRGRWRLKQIGYRLAGARRLHPLQTVLRKQDTLDISSILNERKVLTRHGLTKATLHFTAHHEAHAIPAYFYSRFDDALIYTADGIGDGISYSARVGSGGALELLFGQEKPWDRDFVGSVGTLYAEFTGALGFMMARHEGKVTGLAGFGQPKAADEIARHFSVDSGGEISSDFESHMVLRAFAKDVCSRLSREDAAASVQEALERIVCAAIEKLVELTGQRSLVASGGVFSNVRLNRRILENTGINRIFLFPAMADEGLPVGCCLSFLHRRDGSVVWQKRRHSLEGLYLGQNYDGRFKAAADRMPTVTSCGERPVERAVEALIAGSIVAIYTGRMEYGPRALGARSILASPIKREVNDMINKRLERSEFMPFAPVVLEEYAAKVFDITSGNEHAARFMTIGCNVKPEWRARIPAVVHVDGSARPQIIRNADNPLYYEVLDLFHRRTGLPVLINTSFNVHEEPIVDTPEQALKSLTEGRVDFILTNERLYSRSRKLEEEPAQ
jgi:carbamoyltransferase